MPDPSRVADPEELEGAGELALDAEIEHTRALIEEFDQLENVVSWAIENLTRAGCQLEPLSDTEGFTCRYENDSFTVILDLESPAGGTPIETDIVRPGGERAHLSLRDFAGEVTHFLSRRAPWVGAGQEPGHEGLSSEENAAVLAGMSLLSVSFERFADSVQLDLGNPARLTAEHEGCRVVVTQQRQMLVYEVNSRVPEFAFNSVVSGRIHPEMSNLISSHLETVAKTVASIVRDGGSTLDGIQASYASPEAIEQWLRNPPHGDVTNMLTVYDRVVHRAYPEYVRGDESARVRAAEIADRPFCVVAEAYSMHRNFASQLAEPRTLNFD